MLDKRFHAYRDDLADAALKTQIEAQVYVLGEIMHIGYEITLQHCAPSPQSMIGNALLPLENVRCFEIKDGVAWVQSLFDNYVGYIDAKVLKTGEAPKPSHYVIQPLSHVYEHPNMKTPPIGSLAMGSGVSVFADAENGYVPIATGGYVYEKHLLHADAPMLNLVKLALKFLNTPYIWGGKSGLGIDCTGLLQTVYRMHGKLLPRDSDVMYQALKQYAHLDRSLLKAGDIIFWKGHVALVVDQHSMIHANAHHMCVYQEAIDPALKRIEDEWGSVIGFIDVESL